MSENEPIFSSLAGKGTGFATVGDNMDPENPWTSSVGTYCPNGTFDGVNYYINNNGYPGGWVMFRENGYWYLGFGNIPGASEFGGPPPAFVQSNSSTPPLTGWSNGGQLSANASC